MELDTIANYYPLFPNKSIILLLISPDFVASNYQYEIELRDAMARHEAGEAIVVPILLRPVAGWKNLPFAKLQVYPSGGKPVTQWVNRDEALVDVAKGIRESITKLIDDPFFSRIKKFVNGLEKP